MKSRRRVNSAVRRYKRITSMTLYLHRTLAIVTLVFALIGFSTAQQRKQFSARLNPSKATVYVSFDSARADANGDPRFRLKLHNNTRWKIICYLTPGRSRLGELPVIYKVQDDKRNEIYSNHSGDVVFQHAVLPGKSVAFLVSKEHLKRGTTVYVEYNYPWEIRGGISPYGVEPNHRVFYGW
ncbi:MAG: hypothetical protein ACT4OT_02255 [Acidobacteriota bacterium]